MHKRPPLLSRLIRDQQGTILVFWAVALGVILGIVALSFDLGRASITRSELQSFADSVALAAAGELDGNADAITRATSAAALIVDQQSFGNTERVLSGNYTLTFFASLPASDATAMTDVTVDPADAIFVRVSVTPTTVESTFGAAFAALTGRANRDFTLGATAVAGLSSYACDVTPMMFCLPSAGYHADDHIGEMILLRSGGNGAAWGPGDFGFLDPDKVKVDEDGPCAGLNGAQQMACLLGAADHLTQCFNQRGVDMEPGQKVGLENAIFNVRFDIYNSIMNGKRNNPDYAPAPNVIKGIVPRGGGSCIGNNSNPSPDTVGMPRDDCFGNGSCTRFGNGIWSNGRSTYVTSNYNGTDPHPAALTRYQYYLAEIATSGAILTGKAETGRPICSNSPPAGPDRRVITVAAIDCAANSIRGAASNVPVAEFFKIFLTEPVQNGGAANRLDIYGEIIGSASETGTGAGGTGGIFRDVVQLYR
ncbi:MAG: TadE/TadG family type IV pilus assembly protein [Paracoccaceae bacterium]